MLNIYNDNTPVTLTEEQKEELKKILTNIRELNSFAFMLLQGVNETPQRILTRNDVHTIMSLNASYHSDLGKLLNYSDIIVQEEEQRHKEIREANLEIRALKEELGGKQTPASLQAGLMNVENKIRTWYTREGFHYMADEHFSAYGIYGKLTDELTANVHEWDVWPKNAQPDFAQKGKRLHLLDTDNNRKKMETLIATALPGGMVQGYESHINIDDKTSPEYTLDTLVFIPYEATSSI